MPIILRTTTTTMYVAYGIAAEQWTKSGILEQPARTLTIAIHDAAFSAVRFLAVLRLTDIDINRLCNCG